MAEQYVIFIVEPDWNPDDYGPDDFQSEGKLHQAFADAVRAAGGQVLGSDALQPTSAAVRITPTGERGSGEAVFTDGPFPELKEVVTGYYVIEMPDRESALRVAAKVPTGGWLEMRPVFDMSDIMSTIE
jgi:hypothetical protein